MASRETANQAKPLTSDEATSSKTGQDDQVKAKEQEALLRQAKEALIKDGRRFENNRSGGSGGTEKRSRPLVNTNFLSRLMGAPQVNKKQKKDITKRRDKKK
uniref:RRP15-like protein n=1 Tax=Panagrellus redivivus TaxID=6233 RepID=A0A7E4W2P1_PANRE